jgi:hypothetical protein
LDKLPKSIFRHWVHSREEDYDDIQVFRLSTYSFPPARGRDGFEIKSTGEFIEYDIGRDDRPRPVVGHFIFENGRLRVQFGDPSRKPLTFEIVSLKKDQLLVKNK